MPSIGRCVAIACALIGLLGCGQSDSANYLPPMISVVNGTLTLLLPPGTLASVAYYTDDQGHFDAPVPLATSADLTALEARLTASIASATSSLSALIGNINSDLTTRLNNKVDLSALNAIDSHVAEFVTGMLAPNQTNALYTQLNSKVDKQQLTVIDGEVRSVVSQMLAGVPPNNDLQTAMNSKLTASPTCQCFSASAIMALNATVIAEATMINKTLSCHQQGFVYSQTTDTCIYAQDFPDCGIVIPQLDLHASITSCVGTKGTHAQYGATCTASCNQGYSLSSAVFTCSSNATWTGPALVCTPISCSTLSAPANGAVSGSAGVVGDVRTFTCNTGYQLTGASSLSCQPSGSWSQLSPLCIPQSCGIPIQISNGVTSFCAGTPSGQTCNPLCVPGYTLQQVLTCNLGVWSGNAACIPTPCNIPPTYVSNSNTGVYAACTGAASNTTCLISCNPGYTTFSPTYTCLYGAWYGAPSCNLAACPANAVGAPSCACNTGYIGPITFNPVTGWQGSCLLLACPANGGSAPACACGSGFLGNLTFNPSLGWQGSCQAAQCPTNASGAPSCVCNAGYMGALTFVAGVGWSGTCVVANCASAPPAVANGAVSSCVGTASGNNCAPTCIAGFTATANYSCFQGTWLGSASCICQTPPGTRYLYNYTGSLQYFTVPCTVFSMDIEARGAQGGMNSAGNVGRGARMAGTFSVTPGQVLTLLVGGSGTPMNAVNNVYSGSGGGGTFVVTASNSPLVVAGGGGGAGYVSDFSQSYADASITTTGNPGYEPSRGSSGAAPGGSGGSGGSAGRLTPGGGGFNTDGAPSNSDGGNSIAGAGKSFLNGGAGGTSALTAACYTYIPCPGGYGGGGGAAYAAAGAGGGYSGGGGTDGCDPGSGGGGGSYNSGTNQINTAGFQLGHGQVIITTR